MQLRRQIYLLKMAPLALCVFSVVHATSQYMSSLLFSAVPNVYLYNCLAGALKKLFHPL